MQWLKIAHVIHIQNIYDMLSDRQLKGEGVTSTPNQQITFHWNIIYWDFSVSKTDRQSVSSENECDISESNLLSPPVVVTSVKNHQIRIWVEGKSWNLSQLERTLWPCWHLLQMVVYTTYTETQVHELKLELNPFINLTNKGS